MRAAGVIARELMGGMGNAVRIQKSEACLLAVGFGQPAHKMIEAAVLHRDDDDVINPGGGRIGQLRQLADSEAQPASQQCGSGQSKRTF